MVLAPSGRPFDDSIADEFAGLDSLTLLSGRYEGIDERVREELADDAVSIGPYVLSGGEPAAMVVADAVLRKLPGALGDERSAVEESFSSALEGGVEYPHYTRPAVVSWLGGARRPAIRPPRAGAQLAPGAGAPAQLGVPGGCEARRRTGLKTALRLPAVAAWAPGRFR